MANTNSLFQARFQAPSESSGRAMPGNTLLFLGSVRACNFIGRAFPGDAFAVQRPSDLWSIPPPRHRECQAEKAWSKKQAVASQMESKFLKNPLQYESSTRKVYCVAGNCIYARIVKEREQAISEFLKVQFLLEWLLTGMVPHRNGCSQSIRLCQCFWKYNFCWNGCSQEWLLTGM